MTARVTAVTNIFYTMHAFGFFSVDGLSSLKTSNNKIEQNCFKTLRAVVNFSAEYPCGAAVFEGASRIHAGKPHTLVSLRPTVGQVKEVW